MELVGSSLDRILLAGADLRTSSTVDIALTGAVLTDADFSASTHTGIVSLNQPIAERISFRSSQFFAGFETSASTGAALLNDADFGNSAFDGGALFVMNTELRNANFENAAFRVPVIFANVDLAGAVFDSASFDVSAEFSSVNLLGASFVGANFTANMIWLGTTCPDGTTSESNDGTCIGHLVPWQSAASRPQSLLRRSCRALVRYSVVSGHNSVSG